MKTQKELLEEHRLELEQKWKIKFPAGRFLIQIRPIYPNAVFGKCGLPQSFEGCSIVMAKEMARRTSHTAPMAFVVSNATEREYNATPSLNGFLLERYVSSTWGFVKDFDNKSDLINFARKIGIKETHILTFDSVTEKTKEQYKEFYLSLKENQTLSKK